MVSNLTDVDLIYPTNEYADEIWAFRLEVL